MSDLPAAANDMPTAVAALVAIARRHLDEALRRLEGFAAPTRLAFLPLATTQPLLVRIEKVGAGILSQTVEPSPLGELMQVAWARVRGLQSRK